MAFVRRRWPRVVAAWGLAACAAAAAPARAQLPPAFDARELPPARTAAELRVEGFDVEQARALAPGVPLVFTVFGTPGALATVQIEGARRGLELREVQPGVYEGRYVVGVDDRIAPDGRATATLRRGAQVARMALEEPLQLGAAAPLPPLAQADGGGPSPAREPQPETDTTLPPPRRDASPASAGALPPPIASPSRTSPPVASAPPDSGPVPRSIDPPAAEAAPAPAMARTEATASLPSAAAAPAPSVTPAPMPAVAALPQGATPLPAGCADCAVVEAIHAVALDGDHRPVATVSGMVIGALFGEEAARAHDRRVGRVLGFLGGARDDRRPAGRTRYDVVLRLPGGGTRTRSYLDRPPELRVGDTVRLEPTVAQASRGWPAAGGRSIGTRGDRGAP